MAAAPYVFISYSWDSDLQSQRVLQLANSLRREGVEAWLDKWEQSPPATWPQWCHDQIEKADYVVVICTETYARRATRQDAPGVGRGATWEGAIVANEIYDANGGQSKFIPAIFEQGDAAHVPFFLQGYTVYRLWEPGGFEDLYRRLTAQQRYVPAPLGAIVTLPPAPEADPMPVSAPPSAASPFATPTAAPQATSTGAPQATPTTAQPAAAPPPPAPVPLATVIEGAWAVEIRHPQYGALALRIQLTGGSPAVGIAPRFAAQGIVGPPGWMAAGEWEVVVGDHLALRGTQQTGLPPFVQTGLYQQYLTFTAVSSGELTGLDSEGIPLRWTRERQ